jgi:ribosomal protein S18 acetylase RimI-like enzyme
MSYRPLLSLLLLHLWLQCSSYAVPVEAFSSGYLHRYRRRQRQSHRVTASFTSQQHTIHYSSISSSVCTTTTNTIIKSSNNIKVSQINSNHDILSLADLRYQEWMSADPNPPSLHNFRLATMDICQERCMHGATIFLAKKTTTDDDDRKSSGSGGSNNWGDESVVVGAAELSPIELKDVIVLPTYNTIEPQQSQTQTQPQQQQINNNLIQYITDVVTSTTSRRLGVGTTLMNAIEQSAWDMGTRCLLLHVEVENELARRFYDKLNYIPVVVDQEEEDDDDDEITTPLNLEESVGHTVYIDVNRLALNAGTTGQLLLMKELSSEPPVLNRGEEDEGEVNASRESVKGFGMKSVKRKQKKKMAR